MMRSGTAVRVAFSTVVATLVLIAGACSIENVLPEPSCIDGDSVIHAAQSVPTAELIPCFEPMPAGWDVSSVTIDQDGTVVRFDSDRAGDSAAIFHFVERCELGAAVSVPSEYDGARRYDLIESVAPASFRAQRFYVFTGGCMWWQFDFDEEATAGLSIELGDRLTISTREALNESIRQTFIDEEV